MKKYFCYFILLLSPALMAGEKRYQLEQGIVIYQLTGSQQGTETLYFDSYGLKEARVTQAKMQLPDNMKALYEQMLKMNPAAAEKMQQAQNKAIDKITIINPELDKGGQSYIYSIDRVAKKGTKIINSFGKGMNQQQMQDLGSQTLTAMGYKQSGTTQIAGKTCKLWINPQMGSTCVWNNIALSTKVNIMGASTVIKAIAVKEQQPDPEIFTLPASIPIQDMGNISDMLKNMQHKRQ